MSAMPISRPCTSGSTSSKRSGPPSRRSEEHTSELQSRLHLVCRLLLEKKNTQLLSRHQLSYISTGNPLPAHNSSVHTIASRRLQCLNQSPFQYMTNQPIVLSNCRSLD